MAELGEGVQEVKSALSSWEPRHVVLPVLYRIVLALMETPYHGITPVALPRGVLSTTDMGGLSREVTPPRGV